MHRRFRGINRDSAPHLFQCSLDLARCLIQTRFAKLLALWWGVRTGQNCSFYGLPLFRRLPGSTIIIGDNCQFRSSKCSNLIGVNRPCIVSTLRKSAQVQIGNGCGFSGTIIACASTICIGNRVMCGANVTITDTDWHPIDWRDRIANRQGASAPVVIADDVWLGLNVIVLKGVAIGGGTVVGAGSIVTKSLPAGVVAAGRPAAVIHKLAGDHISEESSGIRSLVEDRINS
jgi:acetyltransferase-like isoleucine patch superfamily enzyme